MSIYADKVSGNGTYPPARTLTGTVSSAAYPTAIIGAGTTFDSNLTGTYLYANNQCRKILSVQSLTHLTLENPFSTPLSGATLKVVDLTGLVTVINLSVNDVTINEQTYATGVETSFEGVPLWYSTGANEIQIEVQHIH